MYLSGFFEIDMAILHLFSILICEFISSNVIQNRNKVMVPVVQVAITVMKKVICQETVPSLDQVAEEEDEEELHVEVSNNQKNCDSITVIYPLKYIFNRIHFSDYG